MMSILTQNQLLEKIQNIWRDSISEIGEFRGQTYIIIINKHILKDLVKFLKEIGFNHLQTLTAVDYINLDKTFRFEVVYQLYSLFHKISLRLRVKIPENEPIVDSITEHFPSANFLEREVYDLFGIEFRGHPNLKRILLPESWKGYPLRKDYPLEPEEKPEEFLDLEALNERLKIDGIK